MATRPVDLEGLPEPDVRAILEDIEFLRRQATAKKTQQTPDKAVTLPVWSLGVIGKLTREEIYDDRV